jgi:4-amino-4-deoxy-L-arabinose transferase-like glycosyltransferase
VRRHLFLLLAACLGLWSWSCGLWDLWGPDESRYVLIARELLPRHNWFLLTLYGRPYDQKPPLPFWLFAAMLKLHGGVVSSALVRLPSVAFATLAVLMTYLIGRRLWGERAGLLAGFILLTSAQFMEDAPAAELNIMYTGWTTLALGIWFLSAPAAGRWEWWRAALFWGAVAGAFFTKGPLAVLIVVSALGGAAWAARSARPLTATRPVLGLLGVLALAGLWLWLQARAAGGQFVAGQVKGQTLDRFLSGSHQAPFYYYFPRLFTSIFVPWGGFLIPAGLRLKRLGRGGLPAGMGALRGWVLVPFLVLVLANGKRQAYLLPLLPAMALIVAWYFETRLREGRPWPVLGRVLGGLDLAFGVALLGAAAALLARPGLAAGHGVAAVGPFGVVMLALAGAGALALGAWSLRRTTWPALPAISLTATMWILGLVTFSVVNPALNPAKSSRAFSCRLEALAQGRAGGVVGAIGKGSNPEYHVYGAYRVVPLVGKIMAAGPQKLPALLVGRAGDWRAVPGAVKCGYHLAWRGVVSKDVLEVYEKTGGR